MQSLRKGTLRSSESRPRNQAPQKLAKPLPGRSIRKSRVDDKIKKRLSMRYADISSPTGYDVPDVPTIPIGVRQDIQEEDETVRDVADARHDPLLADLEMLGSDSFDPDAFLKVKLANSTEAEIKSLQHSLHASKDTTASDLRRNVFKNYAEFMTISKEISTLENELLELKESLSEWRNMPSVLHIDDSASVADRRRTQRSSVADLRILYANQMQTLHGEVEGSSQLVPTVPGRHIVAEMDGVLLLNPATYKVENSIRLFLLDDIVLLARRRQRRAAGRPGYVADLAWPLNQILVLDTKDTASMSNVFKIRFGNDTRVLRTETSSDKKSLLVQFRQVAEELAVKKLKERESLHERRKSQWGTGWMERRSFALNEAVPTLPDWMKEFAANEEMGKTAARKADEDVRWVTEFLDRLTAAVALKEWKKAVDLIEEGEAKSSTTPILNPQLNALKTDLTSSLLHALRDPANRKSTVVDVTSMLVRLQAGAAAQSTFLATRSDIIRKRIRMITPNGNIPEYISDLAVVVFTCIKHTADWYLASFKDNDLTSTFVEWATKQIEHYANMFRAQVYCYGVEDETVQESIAVTRAHSKKLLAEYGLDFGYLFDALLVSEPKTLDPPKLHSHKASISVASIDSAQQALAEASLDGPSTPLPERSNPAPPPRSRNRPSLIAPPTPVRRRPGAF